MLLKLLSLCVVVAMASGQNALPANLQPFLDQYLALTPDEQSQLYNALVQTMPHPDGALAPLDTDPLLVSTWDGDPFSAAYDGRLVARPDGSGMSPSSQHDMGGGGMPPPPQGELSGSGMSPSSQGELSGSGMAPSSQGELSGSGRPLPPLDTLGGQTPPHPQDSQMQFARPFQTQFGPQRGPPQFGSPKQQFGRGPPFGRGRPSSIMNAFGG